MTLWLAIPLALLLLVMLLLLLVLASSIHFHFRLCRLGKDDRIELDVRALYGLVKFHYELPELVFESIEQGIQVKLEKSGIAPVKQDSDKREQIDKEAISEWFSNIRTALKATRGLRKWLVSTLSHVQITKLDWSTDFSLGDAAHTATAAGALWGMKWTMIGWVSRFVRLQHSPRMFVAPVFRDEPCFSTEAVCTGKLSAGYACYAGLQLLRRIAKVEGGLGRWKELLSRVRQ
ncbi:DUF2953 domain-containing protein [Paenibacillus sp. MMS20-IR301]|uniref:DUF2953 domain-containing protein n=1 Tax=Paenibacillus sp. MMS20-IR301 TaxID=2895946 RepID=UPI0028EAEC7A|nr:DUF2953 domain-containing protein [Paenibacillus sp. MMS20-IR301]WNS44441.1 DUF2953 domain-containing protein [Paenibacillus sp. MMS20-IR301]